MTSESQERKIREKILKVAKDILINGGPINGVSVRTGISTSSVQRYLNDSRLKEMLNEDDIKKINEILETSKKDGLRKGGLNSTMLNEPLRDSEGHFIGNKKR